MAGQGIRARRRAEIEAAVVAAGRRQLAEVGAAALSVRAVARDLDMASSAIYRYVSGRDELLTLLIVTAYDELADAVDAALARVDTSQLRASFYAIGRSMRAWAIAHPHDHALLFGSPVPHYRAPGDRTTAAGTRVPMRLAALLRLPHESPPSGDPAALLAGAGAIAPIVGDPAMVPNSPAQPEVVQPEVVQRGLAAWTLLLGAINAEVFGYLGDDSISDPAAHFDTLLALAVDLVTTAAL
ncbi:MAG: TetR/AcrR family transcriptional regulator [Nocardioides sp.]